MLPSMTPWLHKCAPVMITGTLGLLDLTEPYTQPAAMYGIVHFQPEEGHSMECFISTPALPHLCRYFAKVMGEAADRLCGGKLLFFHEGGYSAFYVPFCGVAVLEQLTGFKTTVVDPVLCDGVQWGYQELQPWQGGVIEKAETGPLALLKSKVQLNKAAAKDVAASAAGQAAAAAQGVQQATVGAA